MVRKPTLFLPLLTLLTAALLVTGCDEQKPAPVASAPKQEAARIVVPDVVRGQWQAVRIGVFDKGAQQGKTYLVNLGSDCQVPDSNVSIHIDNYLPAFVVDNRTLTSLSNEPTNPAVEITIYEEGKQVYHGWLFQRFPEAHAFQHPRFNFSLVEAIKVAKKKG